MTTAVLLDRVQKHLPLSAEAVKKLRKGNLIEGKMPNIYISKSLAQSTGKEVEYSKQRPFSDEFCCNLILKALEEHRSLPRRKINDLVLEYLQHQDEQHKIYKVGNLMAKLKRNGKISLNENKEWELSK